MSEVAVEIIVEEIKEEVETREIIVEQCGAQPFGLPATNEEIPSEPVKMKKPRAKAKAAAVAIAKEDIMEAVKEATKKPVPDKPDKNKEM
eukprot:11156698-Heterocapsa_arctica.AAC.1